MGARNVVRTLTEALIAGYQWDTDGQTLKWLPEVDNSGTLQIGDGTTDIDIKVHTGSSTGFFLIDVSANTVQCNSDFRINMSDGYVLADASTNIVQINGFLQANKTRTKSVVAAGTTTLTEDDFGKVVICATNHHHITLPNPVGNAGATFEFFQVITRNTVLQSVNATAGKFGWDGDNAINTIRINSAGDWIRVISSDVDWYIGAMSNTQGHITKNVAASF